MSECQFDRYRTPLRIHKIYAYAPGEGQLPPGKVLITLYEEQFLGERYRDNSGKSCIRYKRLQGFKRGMAVHGHGTIRFSVRSPELPYFGSTTSQFCKNTPVLYSSSCTETGPTPFRYFLNGLELSPSNIPPEHAIGFDVLLELKMGFVPGRITIDQFLA